MGGAGSCQQEAETSDYYPGGFFLFIAVQPVVDLFTETLQKTLSDTGDSKAFQKKECLMNDDILTSSQIYVQIIHHFKDAYSSSPSYEKMQNLLSHP